MTKPRKLTRSEKEQIVYQWAQDYDALASLFIHTATTKVLDEVIKDHGLKNHIKRI